MRFNSSWPVSPHFVLSCDFSLLFHSFLKSLLEYLSPYIFLEYYLSIQCFFLACNATTEQLFYLDFTFLSFSTSVLLKVVALMSQSLIFFFQIKESYICYCQMKTPPYLWSFLLNSSSPITNKSMPFKMGGPGLLTVFMLEFIFSSIWYRII